MILKYKYIWSNIKKKKGYLLCTSDEEERGEGHPDAKDNGGCVGDDIMVLGVWGDLIVTKDSYFYIQHRVFVTIKF